MGWSGTGLTGTDNLVVNILSGSTGDRSYTANFDATDYAINYNLNGGSANNPLTYTIDSNAITLNNPTKLGYIFTGWSGTDLTGNDNMNVTIPAGSTGNRSYTANYILDVITINSFTATSSTLYVGSTDYLGNVNSSTTTSVNYSGTANTISYSSGNTSVATVSNNGVITAVG